MVALEMVDSNIDLVASMFVVTAYFVKIIHLHSERLQLNRQIFLLAEIYSESLPARAQVQRSAIC
jgi:hypothetical protein